MMSSKSDRRRHTEDRTSENFSESGLETLTGVEPHKWGKYTVKELLDNALDFGGDSPEIRVEMGVSTNSSGEYVTRILVSDDGPGIATNALGEIFGDVDVFAGNKRHYNLPERGKQGNALMTLLGIQHLCGGAFRVETRGVEYGVQAAHNAIQDEYEITVERVGSSDVDGTLVEVRFDAHGPLYTNVHRERRTIEEFTALNPHAKFTLCIGGEETTEIEHTAVESPTRQQLSMGGAATTGKATWFSSSDFADRVKADVRAEPDLTLRQFVGEFKGLRTKRDEVVQTFADLGFSDVETVAGLVDEDGQLRETATGTLHAVMCERTTAFSDDGTAGTIGSVGEDLRHHLTSNAQDIYTQLEEAGEAGEFDGPEDLVLYYNDGLVLGTGTDHTSKTVPFCFELAVVPREICGDGERPRSTVVFGVNQSVIYSTPSFGYPNHLEVKHTNGSKRHSSITDAFDDFGHEVSVVCNLTCPNPGFTDKGKQSFKESLFKTVIEDILGKAARKLEGDIRPRLNAVIEEPEPDPEPEPTLYGRADKSFIKDFVFEHFWDVYNEATDEGRFSLTMRDFYYAIREPLLNEAKRRGYKYRWNSPADDPKPFKFTQKTSNRHVGNFEEEHIGHRVLERDDRGFFAEPHTGRHIPLGTKQVDTYNPSSHLDEYDALLYIEKTGRMDILEQTEIAKEYDIGVVNGKGYPTTAARDLIDDIQTAARQVDREIPIYTLTDFDISGVHIREDVKEPDELSSAESLNAEHLGLTLEDIKEYDLTSEPVDIDQKDKTELDNSLEEGTVDEATYEFLTADGGQRVEINALSPVALIDYLEDKFEALGVEKYSPDDEESIKDEPFMNQFDFDEQDTLNEDAATKGTGQWVTEQRTDIIDLLADDLDIGEGTGENENEGEGEGEGEGEYQSKKAAIGAEFADEQLSEAVEELPRDNDEAAAKVFDELLDRLDDNPPKKWRDVARDAADDIRDEYGGEVTADYKDAIADAIADHLSENYELDISPKED